MVLGSERGSWVVTEQELHKGAAYIWRKGDPTHEARIRVTQITRNLVRAVTVPKNRYGSFWNPKCIFFESCTPVRNDI
jgi:hypothetical protein